jgi:hypothetical protein
MSKLDDAGELKDASIYGATEGSQIVSRKSCVDGLFKFAIG